MLHLTLGDVPYVPAGWDTPCAKRLARVNLFSLHQKIAPFSVLRTGRFCYLDYASSLCEAGDELLEDVGHLDERVDRDKLVDAVVAIAAGREVGAG